MADVCPLCHGHPIAEAGPVVVGADGLPEEAAARHGFGVPVQMVPNTKFLVDGKEVPECVAYSRTKGWLVANQLDADGVLRVDPLTEGPKLRHLTGVVTLEPMA